MKKELKDMWDCLKGYAKGTAWGLYTPFNVKAGVKHFIENDRVKDTQESVECVSDMTAQIYSSILGHGLPVFALGGAHPLALPAYVTTLTITNTAVYIRDTNRRLNILEKGFEELKMKELKNNNIHLLKKNLF